MTHSHRITCLLLSTTLCFGQMAHSIELQTGLNGTWHNPDHPGQGLVVQAAPANNIMFVAWFTYTADDGKQQWFTAQGDLSTHPVDLTVLRTTGGAFDEAEPAPQTTIWGQAALTFHDCLNATFSYSGEQQGQISLTRITPPLNCVEGQP